MGAGERGAVRRRPAPGDAVRGERGRGVGELPPVLAPIAAPVQVSLLFLKEICAVLSRSLVMSYVVCFYFKVVVNNFVIFFLN